MSFEKANKAVVTAKKCKNSQLLNDLKIDNNSFKHPASDTIKFLGTNSTFVPHSNFLRKN